jgi:hypothetical protein
MNHHTIEFMARDRIADMRREAVQAVPQDETDHDASDPHDRAPIRRLWRIALRLQASHRLGPWNTHRTSS